MTAEQDVVKAKEKISELKSSVMDALNFLVCMQDISEVQKRSAVLDYQRKATTYFNYAEEFVGNSDLLGARQSRFWAQGFAEDCFAILELIPQHFELLRLEFNKLDLSPTVGCEPAPNAFANMQRMVALYLPEQKADMCTKFQDSDLPIYGFKNKAKDFMNAEKKWSFISGVAFLIVLLIIALVKPDPSKFQYTVFRTVLSLAGAGIGAVLPGFLLVNVKNWIRAGGALAIFVLVYFWNPAALV